MKFFRPRVWETRHLGVTGWELLSHFSDVWCSSLLQLTRSSNWQRESLFRCQMWPWWMYVSNNIITQENRSRLTRFYTIFMWQKLRYLNDSVQRQTSATVRHLTATGKLNSYLPQRTGYHSLDVNYPSNRHQEKCVQSASTFCVTINIPKHCIAVQPLKAHLMLRYIFEFERRGPENGIGWWPHRHQIK